MTEKQLNLYDRLINEPSNDWDIYYWATGTGMISKQHDVKNRMTCTDLSLEYFCLSIHAVDTQSSRPSTPVALQIFQSVQSCFIS